MVHKCDGCRYKGQHQEMMFQPMGVCQRTNNLVEAVQNYEAEKCPYKKTNADRIRAMSDDELAKHFSNLICDINEGVEYHEAPSRWLDWLKHPVE